MPLEVDGVRGEAGAEAPQEAEGEAGAGPQPRSTNEPGRQAFVKMFSLYQLDMQMTL